MGKRMNQRQHATVPDTRIDLYCQSVEELLRNINDKYDNGSHQEEPEDEEIEFVDHTEDFLMM